ncbi:MAG TPA: DUF3820 family protein [Dehalococcoidia bacterium]|nr:DUF3820 family protein [Dehalococcoidia bacterium]
MTVRMPFGRWRGHPLRELPTSYLAWLWDEADLREPLAGAVRAELARRLGLEAETRIVPRRPPEALLPAVREIVRVGYREVARRAHPDVGGDAGLMRDVNGARDWLASAVCGGRV